MDQTTTNLHLRRRYWRRARRGRERSRRVAFSVTIARPDRAQTPPPTARARTSVRHRPSSNPPARSSERRVSGRRWPPHATPLEDPSRHRHPPATRRRAALTSDFLRRQNIRDGALGWNLPLAHPQGTRRGAATMSGVDLSASASRFSGILTTRTRSPWVTLSGRHKAAARLASRRRRAWPRRSEPRRHRGRPPPALRPDKALAFSP